MCEPSEVSLIATGPHGFPAAQQIMSGNLRALSEVGVRAFYIGSKQPFLLRFVHSEVNCHILPDVVSAAVGTDAAMSSPDVLLAFRLACAAAELARSELAHGRSVVLWGTYLFPYAYSMLIAKELLGDASRCRLWITPCGSEIWEIGPQLHAVTTHLLQSMKVTEVITYTDQFASEIKCRYGIERQIHAIPPYVDSSRFYPVGDEMRRQRRADANIPLDAFVISSHSNMRPVKRPEEVLSIAARVAASTSRRVVVLMIGPRRNLDCPQLQLPSLDVRWTGVVERVETPLSVADVELNCSAHDAFNLSLAEAMACGVPCVSSDIVGVADEIRACGAGFLYSKQDERNGYQEAVNYILQLASDEGRRRLVGQRGKAHANAVFSRRRALEKLVPLLVDTSDAKH